MIPYKHEVDYRHERSRKLATTPTWHLVLSCLAGMAVFVIFMLVALTLIEAFMVARAGFQMPELFYK